MAMSAAFQLSPEKVIVTGLPRNDLLHNADRFFQNLPHLEDEKKELHDIKQGKKLVLYAPTYRDNSDQSADTAFAISAEEETVLAAIFIKHNAILGIRDHVFSSRSYFPYLQEHDLAVKLPVQRFSNTNLLLTAADILITDYSSIWVDFLLLNRPVIGFCPDLESYLEHRGFLYDFHYIFPGLLTPSVTKLASKLDTHLSTPGAPVSKKQRMLCQLFHRYSDGKNTERVLNAIESRCSSH
jgi:CDP-glycerol glycerophosphotransferase (TagB/SpsB family)